MVHTQARDHINFCGIVPIRLGVEVNGLELVLFLLIQIAHLSEDLTVTWYFGYQNVVPLKSLASHADKLVNMSDLIYHLITVRDDSV